MSAPASTSSSPARLPLAASPTWMTAASLGRGGGDVDSRRLKVLEELTAAGLVPHPEKCLSLIHISEPTRLALI
eukprot:5139230-Alexandrium_andersonii.AAC.1